MAAGKSTRTYPLTLTQPKPLLHIGNKPILAHQLDQFAGLIDEAILIVGYKHDMLREYFGDSYEDIRLTYVEQTEQLGTGHAVMQVREHIQDRLLVMNGDDLYAREDIDVCLRYQYALLAHEVQDPRQYGVLTVEDGLVTDLIEKPERPASNLTSVGMYVFDRKIFDILANIPKSPRGEYEITDAIKQLTHTANVHCHVLTGYWIPVGFPWSVINANDFVLERFFGEPASEGAIEPGVKIEGRVALGANSVIRQGSYIQGNLRVGRDCTIGPHCHISGNTAIGDGSYISSGASVKNSVIGKQCRIAPVCNLMYSVIGDAVEIGSGTVTMSAPTATKTVTSVVKGEVADTGREQLGAIISSQVTIQPHVVTYPGIKIAPDTIVRAGTVVAEDI